MTSNAGWTRLCGTWRGRRSCILQGWRQPKAVRCHSLKLCSSVLFLHMREEETRCKLDWSIWSRRGHSRASTLSPALVTIEPLIGVLCVSMWSSSDLCTAWAQAVLWTIRFGRLGKVKLTFDLSLGRETPIFRWQCRMLPRIPLELNLNWTQRKWVSIRGWLLQGQLNWLELRRRV